MKLCDSMYCDIIDGECFHWGICDNCREKINAAAYDMIDYYHYDPDQFYVHRSEFKLSATEIESVYQRMKEIIEERTKPLIF